MFSASNYSGREIGNQHRFTPSEKEYLSNMSNSETSRYTPFSGVSLDKFEIDKDLNVAFQTALSLNGVQRAISCDSGRGSIQDTESEISVSSGSVQSFYSSSSTSRDDGDRGNFTQDYYHKSSNDRLYPIDFYLQSWETPALSQQLRIIQQVEYYFSNEYLAKDAYFLRQIRRKKEGYLSTKLITNFKKVRKLVKDPRITAYCLRKSKLLQVNHEGTKVKRIAAVPGDLKRFDAQNCVLALGIPPHLAKIEALMNIFYPYGEMSSVRLIRPGKECPTEISDHLANVQDRNLSTGVNAVIEYEKSESALAVCRVMNSPRKSHGISKISLLTNSTNTMRNEWESEINRRKFRNSRNNSPSLNDWSRPFMREMSSSMMQHKNQGLWREPSQPSTSWPENAHNQMRDDCTTQHTKLNDGFEMSYIAKEEKEDKNLDDEWIKEVVNHVLTQTYKCSISSDTNDLRGIPDQPNWFEDEKIDSKNGKEYQFLKSEGHKTEYSKLHSNADDLKISSSNLPICENNGTPMYIATCNSRQFPTSPGTSNGLFGDVFSGNYLKENIPCVNNQSTLMDRHSMKQQAEFCRI